jgi:hypothetical protein
MKMKFTSTIHQQNGPRIFLLFFVLFLGLQTSAQVFTTTKTPEGIELRENGKKVLFYQVQPKSVDGKFERAGYVHPLYSLNGNSITDDSPKDHPYHRGVFWAWHQIILNNKRLAEGWTSENISWLPVDVKVKRKREAATLHAKVLWKSKLENDRPIDIVKEITSIKVYTATAQYRVIDFDIRLNALVDSLKIGGSEDAKGYGGFCIRLKLPKDISFISGDTVVPQETQVTARPWIDITGSLEGQSLPRSGVIIFANSVNKPQPWILRSVTSMQNVPFPGTAPIDLPRTGVELKYRVIIHNGEMSQDEVEKLYQDYVKQNRS